LPTFLFYFGVLSAKENNLKFLKII